MPLLSAHLGYNPAVTSAPLMTTVVDRWAAQSEGAWRTTASMAGWDNVYGLALWVCCGCAVLHLSCTACRSVPATPPALPLFPRVPVCSTGLVIYFVVAKFVMGI